MRRFFITGSKQERPSGRRVIFCDGSADDSFRPELDIELSHCVPNRTPEAYKADTSTEICMRFVEEPLDGEWDLAINNHIDVDGILSVLTVVKGPVALRHRKTIVQAAEIGDFWAWGDKPAQILFQGLTLLIDELAAENVDPQKVYQQAMDRAEALLNEGESDLKIQDDLAQLERSAGRIASGEIGRRLVTEKFVHYAIPARFDIERALYVPAFNEAISASCVLWPQARAKRDGERVSLVSIESSDGWYYDLWYPGYMWAETPNRWRAPGIALSESTNAYSFEHQPLRRVVGKLRQIESADGAWVVAEEVTPFDTIPGRGFPVVLSFLSDRMAPAPSQLPPEEVASQLANAF